jgi:glutathione S-transferase
MALTIYGSPRSRTQRVLWMATELGLDFEHVPYAWDDPALKQAAFLAINPAGTIPAIVDDGMALAESMAINLYLAKRYGHGENQPLYPDDPAVEAQIWRWSLWAQGQLEPWVQRDFWIADLRAQASENFNATVRRSLSVLERALQDRDWLAGDHFTVGDLNVAAVLSPSRSSSVDLAPHPKVEAWLARCYGREKAQASRAKYG